jgi:hypothetical protein
MAKGRLDDDEADAVAEGETGSAAATGFLDESATDLPVVGVTAAGSLRRLEAVVADF